MVLDDYKGATDIMEHLIASVKKRIAHLAGLDMIDKDVSELKTAYKVLKPELIIRGSS